jgi:hypothetical protein
MEGGGGGVVSNFLSSDEATQLWARGGKTRAVGQNGTFIG